ncbi:Target of Myb protein 1 [Camelus dromedarius]|uniref:Target of Myb protein 1 n=1 Tax=Camelus dromedarius TaxID=9838 RepID=A0A5N4DGG9_CAMDR|nr:Target of Myb protein 1 [Camelus dromedarius]
MDFLLGNPFSSPVGQRIGPGYTLENPLDEEARPSKPKPQGVPALAALTNRHQVDRVESQTLSRNFVHLGPPHTLVTCGFSSSEKATDGSLQSEDWALNMEICDIINETEEGPKDACRAVKKRIVGNKNFHEVMLALTVLETCVKNCGHRFHVLVASQDFVEGVLVRTILPKNNPPTIVHDKVLNLTSGGSWADAFRSSPDLTGVVAVYEDLRRKGLEFPMTDLDMLSPIHTPQRTVFSSETPSGQNSVGTDTSHRGDSSQHTAPLPASVLLPSDTPIVPTPEQIGKLRSELELVSGNVRVMSEMLTELVPTQAEPADLELLQELNRTCRAMQQRVLELIPRVANEQLTEELLIVNDNLNNVFLRHERFERFRTGQAAKAPSEAEAAADLIDMGPDPAATGSLSSQLAGMNLGSSSVRAGLQSLEASGRLEDEFDMFALTRGSSLADQRKDPVCLVWAPLLEVRPPGTAELQREREKQRWVKYEAPQATDGLAGALDARQQSTGAMGGSSEKSLSDWMVRQGMIPVTQACLMEDIEQWLSTDVGNDAEESKGVTSEEFDKFLEERAKVADRLPNLSSPSAEGPPGPPPGTAPRKKTQEKDDDMLFAL